MANNTKCQTPDAIFKIVIKNKSISCKVDLPFELNITEQQSKELEANIHNVLELVLAKYFTKIQYSEVKKLKELVRVLQKIAKVDEKIKTIKKNKIQIKL